MLHFAEVLEIPCLKYSDFVGVFETRRLSHLLRKEVNFIMERHNLLNVAGSTKNTKLSTQAVEEMDIAKLEPEAVIQAVRQFLASGAYVQAQKLASQGASLYPDDNEVVKIARILAPPVVERTKVKSDTSTRANQLWLKRNFDAYQDKWVALRAGALVAVADTTKDLKAKVPDLTGLMVTRV